MSEPLLAIVGPTATGKSHLALQLAVRFDGEVVNGDSRQVYRGLDIGTAKPHLEQRRQVPHHLFDIVDPDDGFSLAQYKRLALQAVDGVHRSGRLPILVGGTGQYLWALLEGWSIPEIPPRPDLRRRLEEKARTLSSQALHQELQAIDPAGAANINGKNVRRIVRALEIYYATGQPPSELQRKAPPPWSVLILGLTMERQALYDRVDRRVDEMVQSGWIEEVKCLLDDGYSEGLPSMSSLGYREIAQYLRGETTLQNAARSIKWNTHRFIRHQYTWFRPSDRRIQWLRAGPHVLEEARALVSNALLCPRAPRATMVP